MQLLDSSSVVAMSLAQVMRLCRKLPQSPQPAQHASICTNSARKDVGHGCWQSRSAIAPGQEPSQPPLWASTCQVLGCGTATSSTAAWQHGQDQAMLVAKQSCTFPTSRLSAMRDAQSHCCGQRCARYFLHLSLAPQTRLYQVRCCGWD